MLILSVLELDMNPPTATTQATATPVAEVNVQARPSLQTRLEAALEHARRLTTMYGSDTIEVAIAWETVGELQKADQAQRQPTYQHLLVTVPRTPRLPKPAFIATNRRSKNGGWIQPSPLFEQTR